MRKIFLILYALIALSACDPYNPKYITGPYCFTIGSEPSSNGNVRLSYDCGGGYARMSPYGVKQYAFDEVYIYLRYYRDIDPSESRYYYIKICNDCGAKASKYVYGPYIASVFNKKLKELGRSNIQFKDI
jgi:hypothetical protein